MEERCARWRRLLSPVALYDDPGCASLATEAAAGRWFSWCGGHDSDTAGGGGDVAEIILREDFYRGWVHVQRVLVDDDEEEEEDAAIVSTTTTVQSVGVDARSETVDAVLEFIRHAATQNAPYRWGGTLGGADGFDCSGLVQTAFASASTTKTTTAAGRGQGERSSSGGAAAASNSNGNGNGGGNGNDGGGIGIVWVPRDAYQQHAFATPVRDARDAKPGDLLFFGPARDGWRVDHVAVLMSSPEVVVLPRTMNDDDRKKTKKKMKSEEEEEAEEENGQVGGYAMHKQSKVAEEEEEEEAGSHVGYTIRKQSEEEEGVVLHFAHSSCKSTGRNGVGFDAVFVPAGHRLYQCTTAKQLKEEEEEEEEGEGEMAHGGYTTTTQTKDEDQGDEHEDEERREPRAAHCCAGDPVAEYYGGRFLCLGRVERGVTRPEDVVWRGGR